MNKETYRRSLVHDHQLFLSIIHERGVEFTTLIVDYEKATSDEILHENLAMRFLLRTPSSR